MDGKEICKAIIDHCFAKGVHRIFAECDPENASSWRSLEALGFAREAHLKQNVCFRIDDNGRPVLDNEFGLVEGEYTYGKTTSFLGRINSGCFQTDKPDPLMRRIYI